MQWRRLLTPGLLSVFVLLVYTARINTLPLRGEEPRRGQVAVEMMARGDWVVPRQQGTPFRSRPPLQNWLIGGVGLVRGQVDAVAIRLPSVLALLLTTLLVYGYARRWLSELGATAAALAFATMGQVLELGGLGETESLFTLLVSGSLLVWHATYQRGWGWVAAYALVGLGVLAKGPQAPVYFVAAVGVYLLATRQWRRALSPWHLAGIVVFLLIWNAWQWAYYRAEGWTALRAMYGGDVAMRFDDTRWIKLLRHTLEYPLEVFACLLPWSVWLVLLTRRDVRQAIGPARDMVLFLAVAIAVTFPTCWLVPGARGRYYMPLYPCFAPLVGLVIDRCFAAGASADLRRWSRMILTGLAVVMIGAACGVVGLSVASRASAWALPVLPAVLIAAVMSACAAIVWRALSSLSPGENGAEGEGGLLRRRGAWSMWACGVFLGLCFAGVIAQGTIRLSPEPPAEAIARVRQQLPPDARLVSFSWIDPLFAFNWRAPIRLDPWPQRPEDIAPDVEYFCFGNDSPLPGPITFRFETLATISCDRVASPTPKRAVVVGRLER